MGMRALAAALAAVLSLASTAQAQPARQDETWTIRNFRFRDGETLGQMKVHYVTLGSPANPAVLVLHGTGGTGAGMLGPAFGGALFGPGQPLDAATHFIVAPDAIGAGASSRPSEGLRMRFPRYDYADMVEVQHRLLTEHLGIKHLQLVIGHSMGGMETWLWGETFPEFMDALVPLASTPTQVAGRNWIARRLAVAMIEADPAWKGGRYTTQPPSLTLAATYFGLMTSGGTRAIYKALPTWKAAEDVVAASLAQAVVGVDANDEIYQFEAARTYDPEPRLGRIKARVLAINSEDDERNPVELGELPTAMKKLANGRYFIIPTSDQTHGHATTGNARTWAHLLPDFLAGK
jgi:homoserine O-acetyltransferase